MMPENQGMLLKYYSPFVTKNRQITVLTFFCHYKNNNKNRREMGLLSLSNLKFASKRQNSLILDVKK